ncbi:MAG TPA: glutaminase [Burkholderiales bacterium]|nr:glutaminase [Burkholderiales bacterium]
MATDYQQILSAIYEETRSHRGEGKVADYIPSLARVSPRHYGLALQTLVGEECHAGDADIPFSIQSISKVFVLEMVYQQLGRDLWQRVGREPSGSAFNSLVQLEHEQGYPRNPFINAGALVLTDCLVSQVHDPLTAIRDFVRRLSGNDTIDYDYEIAASERATGFRNAALVNFIKSFGNIHNDVDVVLDVYFHQCALMMNCSDLARAFLCLANGGVNPLDGGIVLTPTRAKRVNALMQTCGFYDESGEFAFTVGLPGKSGVGGGIVAVIPKVLSVCVWSPALNAHGNSLVGMRALELFTTKLGVSVF